MNVHFAKGDLSFNLPGAVNYSPVPGSRTGTAEQVGPRHAGVIARARAWFATAQRRRRALNELQMLTDRELSDIGLTRSEIPMIFDPGFAEHYDTRRRQV